MERIGLEAVLLMDSFRRGMREYIAGTKAMEDETKQLLQAMQPAGIALAGLGAAGTAFIRSATLTAARTEELGLVLDVLAENARKAAVAEGDLTRASQLSAQAIDGTVAAVKERGITTQVALKLTSQFARYELDMAQASDLARVAQDAAVISMQDSSEALDGLLHGILTYNPRVLRTYGITVQAEDAFKKFAAANGLAADELDNTQRAQAMLNAVLAEGQSISGAYEAAMGSAGKQLRSLNRYWEEAKNALGEAFLPILSEAVQSITALLKWFNELDPSAQRVVAQLLGIGTATAAVSGAVILLTPRITAMAAAFGQLGKLLAQHSSLLSSTQMVNARWQYALTGDTTALKAATTATGGWASAMSAAIPIAAALAAAVMALAAAKKFDEERTARQAEVTDAWTQFLKEQLEQEQTATEIANNYAVARGRVAKEYEAGGVLARMFVNEQKALNADTKTLNDTLLTAAESYDDYLAALERINATMPTTTTFYAGQKREVREQIPVMDELTFSLIRNAEAYEELGRTSGDAGIGVARLALAEKEVATNAMEAAQQVAMMTDALQRVGIAGAQAESAQRAIALATGQMTQLAATQEDALTMLALAYEKGDLSQEAYIQAAQRVLSVTADSAPGYDAIRDAVEGATGGLYELGDSLEGIPESMQDAAAASRQMAEILEKAAQEEAEIAARVVDMEADYNRQIIDININRARAIEDIDRNLAQQRAQAAVQLSQRLAQIEAQAAQQQQQAAQQHARRMQDIEEQYQERLRDIQKRYQESMYDAIANRDATAALEAMRTRDDELEEARRDRDEQQADAQADYARQQEEQRVNLEIQRQQALQAYNQQMADLELSRQEQIDELDRSIRRQMEDIERHNQWEIQAMRNKFSAEYAQAIAAYANEESAYRQHLINMRTIYAQYGWGGTTGEHRKTGGRYATGGAFLATGPTQATFGEAGVPELVVAQPLRPVAGMGLGVGASAPTTMHHEVSGAVEGVMSGFEGRLTGAISQAVLRAFSDVLR